MKQDDQEIPGGETLLLRWRAIDGKIWNIYHKTEQGGGLSSEAYAPPRCNRCKQVSKHHKKYIIGLMKYYNYYMGPLWSSSYGS